jgi:transposase InsO family protein
MAEPEQKIIIYREEMCKEINTAKRTIQRYVQDHRVPGYDIQGQPGYPGHKGQGSGWYLQTLQAAQRPPKRIQKFIEKITEEKKAPPYLKANESQALVALSREERRVARVGPEEVTKYGNPKIFVPEDYPEKFRRVAGKKEESVSLLRTCKTRKEQLEFVRMWNLHNPDFHRELRTFQKWDKDLRDGKEPYPKWGEKWRKEKEEGRSSVSKGRFEDIKEIWLVEGKPSFESCIRRLKEEDPDFPSLSACRRRLRKEIESGNLPLDTIYLYRHGEKAWARKCQSFISREIRTIASGEFYSLDHYQIDVLVVAENGKLIFPYFTGCLDIRSRKMLGWRIGGPPNDEAVRLAFVRACLNFGIPSDVLIDNGKDFRSRTFSGGPIRHRLQVDVESLKAVLFLLQIRGHFSLAFNPQSKAHIERFFRTYGDGFCSLWPTYRGSNVQKRPDQLQKAIDRGEIPTIQKFEEATAAWIRADYNCRPHGGDGMDGRSPDEVWGFNNVARAIDPKSLNLLLLKNSRPLVISRNGVSILGRTYWSECLLPIRGQQIYVRYDPGRMDQVWIYDLKDQFVCTARERERLSFKADEETLRAAIKDKRQQKRIVESYHQVQNEISTEPDAVKRILKKAEAQGVDLSPDGLQAEKPIMKRVWEIVGKKDGEAEEDKNRRRREQRDMYEYLELKDKKGEERNRRKEAQDREDLRDFLEPEWNRD